MRIEYELLTHRAVRIGAAPIIIDDAGLTFKVNNLSSGAYVLRIYRDGGLIDEHAFDNSSEVHIPRRKVKTGLMRMDIVHADCNGVVDSIFACEPIGIYSLAEQVHEPLAAYQEIDRVLEDYARLHDTYDVLIGKIDQLERMLKDYQIKTTAALEDIRGAYKLNLFRGKKQ